MNILSTMALHQLVSILVFVVCVVNGQGSTTSLQKLGSANNEFGLALHNQIADAVGAEGNIFFSPISIVTALGMTHAGAKGDTKSQMRDVLRFDKVSSTDTAVYEAFNKLITFFNEPSENYTITLANRLFGSDELDFLDAFLQITSKYFNASLQELPFSTDPDTSRELINSWVEDKTNDKIKDLLAPGTINIATALVLVNAIYFKGLWALPFDSEDTQKKTFYAAGNKEVEIDMMIHEDQYFKYTVKTSLGVRILELPYGLGEVSMFIILPDERYGLSSVENSLTASDLDTAIANMQDTKIDSLWIPKFKLTQSASLKKILVSMGMEDAFDRSKADFSGINSEAPLVIEEVVHKAFVEVNEEGTEAAAATAVIFEVTSVRDPINFHADHPFLFLIRERESRTNLFTGRLVAPPSEGEETRVGTYNEEPGITDDSAACRLFQTVLILAISATVFMFITIS